ncbi:signal peptide peptidase SppA [Alkalihalobacterium alkalinitrilicum]|uniref:signal peptide peptidase SppA n=1 Tax=Alkalihalobacterium alkalinitrilicum TaxID=427920 RepID=UPI000994998F|nr:signal peptide peptidase SppA [Alkalihalobacterium alkalinitrilicum]
MSKKRWLALLAVTVLFILSTTINLRAPATSSNWDELFSADDRKWVERTLREGDRKEKIVVLDVNGVIQDQDDTSFLFSSVGYRHRTFLSMLEYAAKDPDVEGIIIRVNSPGGGVVESAEIYDKIRSIQEEYFKKIYVSMGSMAASGGYYIAAPADKIFANTSTITGSLGVIMQSYNVSELAEQIGIQEQTIKSGEYKDIMSPTREMTEDERAILQSIIDDAYVEFVDVIVEGRGLPEEEVRNIADGRIYSGSQAVQLDLVDDIKSYEETVDALIEDLGLGNLQVIRYETSVGFNDLLQLSAQRLSMNQGDLLGLQQLVRQTNSPTLMYLYTK